MCARPVSKLLRVQEQSISETRLRSTSEFEILQQGIKHLQSSPWGMGCKNQPAVRCGEQVTAASLPPPACSAAALTAARKRGQG